jgi:ubiquitin-protein ligase E3 B
MRESARKLIFSVIQRVLLKGLCGSKPSLKHVSLFALFTLSLRPLILAEFSEKLLSMYLINILSVPALIHHLNIISPEVKIKTALPRNIYSNVQNSASINW